MPELEEGIGVTNRPKIFTIWEHNLKALEYGAKTRFSPEVCLIALMHDIGKPRAKGPMKNEEWTFYGHDMIGSKMAAEILTRLHFSSDFVKKAAILIRWHLFKYDPDEGVTDSSVRRLIRNVGAENMADLVKIRICDRMGMGVPKAVPYRLRHFQFRVEKILREEEAPTPKMLKIRGEDIMRVLGIEPGPKIGQVIPVNAGQHRIPQAEFLHRFRNLCRLVPVQFQPLPCAFHGAKGAVPCADLPQDHESCRSAAPTISPVWAKRFLADSAQPACLKR